MIKGKTSTGFEFSVDSSVGNDYELVELLANLDEDFLAMTKVVNRVLGKEQSNKLKEHVRNENGIVPTDRMAEEISEIFQSTDEGKNS